MKAIVLFSVFVFVLAGCTGRPRPELFPYRVVCGETKGKLADAVAEWMRRGWQPTGGIEVLEGSDGNDWRWCQALISE